MNKDKEIIKTASKMDAKEENRLTPEQIKNLPTGALARKYKSSAGYVREILKGEKGNKRSYIADKIREDANAILTILEN